MSDYKLLTPGPLTTTKTVKQEMLKDRCTWDDDYKNVTQVIRRQLLNLAQVDESNFTAVLMQGSGSFVVESVLTTAIGEDDKLLIITNGAYGERIVEMAKVLRLAHVVYSVPYDEQPSSLEVQDLLEKDASITHVAVVHCETTTGILNPIKEIGEVVHSFNKTFIVDAMSSFGGVPMDVSDLHIDFCISSANKCIQGVPGFGFVIAKTRVLEKCKGQARSVALDLYSQWEVMKKDGKWRFTSPTHVVAAFARALEELVKEGGVNARYQRYADNNQLLRSRLSVLGFEAYISEELQSPIITTYLFPHQEFSFEHFYLEMKKAGFVIYPGKLTDVDTFRIGNIGDIYEEDMQALCEVIENYMVVKNNEN
ncbi:2-aminoethylphosphonate--pyruvate transaminase [Lysinibacillus fusiformis]|uniref:2-aminoethylphosphonate--pyruvate transaminase n=1 Tax=Lysinibacillus fusiformis TaxID=28031 RepID=UPI00215AE415|nr:2-aminoethylphosphonate--pyruvate transaminase [Lysinibacillus fusiformis]MCR8851395.1 2-aminoethylphosphonate--pyruvate transaminase [Lysinibacillus fusiformis]WKT77922.1 2-aminoethylphosphonate--pyruvate transaminase [Lysinibacillus fusiformis]